MSSEGFTGSAARPPPRSSIVAASRCAGPDSRRRQVVEATRLYERGASTFAIGLRFGVDHKTVASALHRAGVQLRSRRGPALGAR